MVSTSRPYLLLPLTLTTPHLRCFLQPIFGFQLLAVSPFSIPPLPPTAFFIVHPLLQHSPPASCIFPPTSLPLFFLCLLFFSDALYTNSSSSYFFIFLFTSFFHLGLAVLSSLIFLHFLFLFLFYFPHSSFPIPLLFFASNSFRFSYSYSP